MDDSNTLKYKIPIDHLLVLCELGEDYKSFCNDLENLIKFKRDKYLARRRVYHILKGDNLLNYSNKYKKFIKKHNHTIEIMNKYSCLSNFILLSCFDEDYFYQYIQEHKEDIEIIKAVALKIKSLGFETINFDENLDFTENEYVLNYSYGSSFKFLENMEVIPTYLDIPIRYKTNGSCYSMTLHSNYKNYINKYGREIELNSLIFDPNRLPNEITSKSTIEVIKKLAEKKKVEYNDLQNAIDLSITTSDLADYYKRLKKVSERIIKINDNSELTNMINQMQKTLQQLELFGTNFEERIISTHPDINDETIKREKKLYLDRRYWEQVDID